MKTYPLHFLAVAVITALVFSGIALAISALDPSQGTTGPENNSHGDAELDDLQFVATEMWHNPPRNHRPLQLERRFLKDRF